MNKIKIIFCTIFIGFITITGIGTLNNKNQTSEAENRTLTTFPEFDLSQLSDSTYLDSISTAVADQLEWRSNFVKLYFAFNKNILNQTYIGSVVMGKDEVLFNGPIQITNYETYKENIKKGAKLINDVNEVARQYGTKLIVLNIPRKDYVLKDYLPSYYPDVTEQYLECLEIEKSSLSDDISVIDAYSLFMENMEKDNSLYYFYNDHHINAIGNDLILSEIMKIVNAEYPQVEQYRLNQYDILYKQVSGSFNKKIAMAANAPDEVLNLVPKGWDIEYTRYDNGELSETPIINADSNTYSGTFMGGNYGETVVETNREELPSIIYCGSSYTNGLEALSVPSFDNMYSLDFRNNTTDNTLVDYIKQWQPEYVVLISAQSTATFKYSHLLNHLGLDKNIDEAEE